MKIKTSIYQNLWDATEPGYRSTFIVFLLEKKQGVKSMTSASTIRSQKKNNKLNSKDSEKRNNIGK